MTFAEVAAMGVWELSHWAALLRMEPPAERVQQVEGAYTRATIANAAFGSKGGHKLADFLVEFGKQDQQQSPADQSAVWKRWAAMTGGKIDRG